MLRKQLSSKANESKIAEEAGKFCWDSTTANYRLDSRIWIFNTKIVEFEFDLFRLEFWLEFLNISVASGNGQQKKLFINQQNRYHQNSILKKQMTEEFLKKSDRSFGQKSNQLLLIRDHAAQNCTFWPKWDKSFKTTWQTCTVCTQYFQLVFTIQTVL